MTSHEELSVFSSSMLASACDNHGQNLPTNLITPTYFFNEKDEGKLGTPYRFFNADGSLLPPRHPLPRPILPTEYAPIIAKDAEVYPCAIPATNELLSLWFDQYPAFGMMYGEDDEMIAHMTQKGVATPAATHMSINIPLTMQQWEAMVSGEEPESAVVTSKDAVMEIEKHDDAKTGYDSRKSEDESASALLPSTTTADDDSAIPTTTIGVHIYHIEAMTSKRLAEGMSFTSLAVHDLGVLIKSMGMRLEEQKEKKVAKRHRYVRVGGVSAYAVTEAGQRAMKRAGMVERIAVDEGVLRLCVKASSAAVTADKIFVVDDIHPWLALNDRQQQQQQKGEGAEEEAVLLQKDIAAQIEKEGDKLKSWYAAEVSGKEAAASPLRVEIVAATRANLLEYRYKKDGPPSLLKGLFEYVNRKDE